MRKAKPDYNLSTLAPDLATQWHPTKNIGLYPQDFLPKSNKKVWWQCNNGHEWLATIGSRFYGTNCPYCSHQLATKEHNLAILYPEIISEWHFEKNGNITPYDVCPKSDKIVWWICSVGHEWQCPVKDKTKYNHCPYCTNHRTTQENNLAILYPEIAKQWHPVKNGNLDPHKLLPKSNKKIWWLCENGHSWETAISHRTDGEQCPYCVHKRPTKEYNLYVLFPELSKEWNVIKNGLTTPENISPYSSRKVWWKCTKGHEWEATVGNRSRNNTNCPECALSTVSKLGIEWLDLLGLPNDKEHREVNININGKTYRVDGFNPDTKTVYEFLGDFWHGNPEVFCSSDINRKCKKTYGELLSQTKIRFKILDKNGYKIIYKWESSNDISVWNGSFKVKGKCK